MSHALHQLSVRSVIPAVTPHDLHFQVADITQPFVTVLIQGQQGVYICHMPYKILFLKS